MKRSLFVVAGFLLAGLQAACPTAPVPTQTSTAIVIIHLLDADSQPVVGISVNLALNCYSDTIEEIPFGNCVTDTTGTCSITVDNPPRLRSGKVEGFIDLGLYGRQVIGWKGEHFEVTLQFLPDGKLATPSTPLDQPYERQTEQPADAPLSTKTPIFSSIPTRAHSPLTPTEGDIPSTPIMAFTVTSTLPPRPTASDTSTSPIPIPSFGRVKRSGWIWIGLGLTVFAVMDIALVFFYFRQRKSK